MVKIRAPASGGPPPVAPGQQPPGVKGVYEVKSKVPASKKQATEERVKVPVTREPAVLGGFVATVIILILVVLAFPIMAGFAPPVNSRKQSVEYQVIGSLTGQSRNGVYEGMWTPGRIVVRKGESVTLRIRSIMGGHYFSIPELGIRTHEITTGEAETVTFVPKKTGTFVFGCYHRKMVGELVVLPR